MTGELASNSWVLRTCFYRGLSTTSIVGLLSLGAYFYCSLACRHYSPTVLEPFDEEPVWAHKHLPQIDSVLTQKYHIRARRTAGDSQNLPTLSSGVDACLTNIVRDAITCPNPSDCFRRAYGGI